MPGSCRSCPQDEPRAPVLPLCLLGGVAVGELEVGRDLPEIAYDVVRDGAFENGQQRTQGFDRELRLVEATVLGRELPVPQRRNGVQHLNEQVGDLQLLQLLLDLVQQLLVAPADGRLLLAHRGSQSSNRLPSGSVAQPKRPFSISSTRSSTATPAARSWASIASRSPTR